MSSNSMVLRLLAYQPSVMHPELHIMVDVDQYEIVSCDVDPEKGKLSYDITPAAREIMARYGSGSTPARTEVHVKEIQLINEFEVELLKKRGVKVVVLSEYEKNF